MHQLLCCGEANSPPQYVTTYLQHSCIWLKTWCWCMSHLQGFSEVSGHFLYLLRSLTHSISLVHSRLFVCIFTLLFWIFLHFSSFLLFSQSIDPGQQFTWENSNMEVNKPKNRYANVIAYDHSRVVLTSVDGKSSQNHLSLQLAVELFCHWLTLPTLNRQDFFFSFFTPRLSFHPHIFSHLGEAFMTCTYTKTHLWFFQEFLAATTSTPTTLMATESRMPTSPHRGRCRRR